MKEYQMNVWVKTNTTQHS